MERHRKQSILLFRTFLFLIGFVFGASLFLFYMGTVHLNRITMDFVPVPIKAIEKSSTIIPSSSAVSRPVTEIPETKSILLDKLKSGVNIGAKNLHGQLHVEFRENLRTSIGHVPPPKARVKRFACWHSCFGQFRKKVFGKPDKQRPATVRREFVASQPTISTPVPIFPRTSSKGKNNDIDKSTANPLGKQGANELGDGEDDIGMRSKGNPRVKKTANSSLVDFFKLKTRVIETKLELPTVPTSSHSRSGIGDGDNDLHTTTTLITPIPQKPGKFGGESTKRPEPVLSLDVEKKESSSAKNVAEGGDEAEEGEESEEDYDEESGESGESEEEEDGESESEEESTEMPNKQNDASDKLQLMTTI